MRIGTKFIILGIGGVAISALINFQVTKVGMDNISLSANRDLNALINSNFESISRGTYYLIKATDEALRTQVERNLEVGMYLLSSTGAFGLLDEVQEVPRLDKNGKAISPVVLPIMSFGDTTITSKSESGKNLLSQLVGLVGGQIAIFQRIEQSNSFVEVASTMSSDTTKTPLGLSILGDDETSNPNLIPNLLDGQRYVEISRYRSTNYVSAFQPLRDMMGDITAVLFVGIPQSQAESLRRTLLETKVGDTGHVFVMQGSGEKSGTCLLSPGETRDGQNMLQDRDKTGRSYIGDIVKAAIKLPQGVTGSDRHIWNDSAATSERWRRTFYLYYKPWDWVVGIEAFEDEFDQGTKEIKAVISRVVWQVIAATLVCIIIGGLVFMAIGKRVSRNMSYLTNAALSLADGNITEAEKELEKV